ncbi:hypothetical protein CHUAL_008776 [Chamberlinius hualienensis]
MRRRSRIPLLCLTFFRLRRTLMFLVLSGLTLFAVFKSLNLVHNSSYTWSSRMFLDANDSSYHALCSLPKLEPNSSVLDKYFHDVPPLRCSQEENWVCVSDGYAKLCDNFVRSNPQATVKCTYEFIERQDDHNNRISTVVKDVNRPVKLVSDFFHVSCELINGDEKRNWRNLMSGIADLGEEFTQPKQFPSDSLGLNVLIFGFDSLSHMSYMRKLPKTYKYLTSVLDAVVLNGYNIVGDGTPQALIPIFTGFTELELPEVRKRKSEANYVNVYPFIWNDYRDAGYVTAYTEDQAFIGTFTYRLRGFNDQPTTHYGRPFYLEVDKVQTEHGKFCLAATPRHKIFLDYVEDFFDHYSKRPKFFFGFHAELSHDDYNLVGLVDNDLVTFLQSFKDKGHLNNTLLIMMSDHGHRFSELRETQQGKQEERLPFFSFIFPPNFKTQHPKAWANINRNVNKLTTPFDIYPTLKDVLKYTSEQESNINEKRPLPRSISLFQKVPTSRSCADAGIEPHWCTCLHMEPVPTSDPVTNKVTAALIQFINDLTAPFRSICHEVQALKVVQVDRYIPHRALLKYKKNSDYDGFVGDFSDNTYVSKVTYFVKVVTTPGDGHFEATLSHDVESDQFKADERSISRVNAYGNSSHCIAQSQHHLHKYCYCRQQHQTQQSAL